MRRLIGATVFLFLLGLVSLACDDQMRQIKTAEQQGDWPKAQEMLQQAIEKRGDDARLHNELGYVYKKRGYYDYAFSEYQRAIQLDPFYLEAYYNRGTLYYSQNQFDNAEKDFEKVLEINPNYALAHNNLGLINHIIYHKYDQALEHYKKAIEIEPENYLFHENLGRLYNDMKKPDLAKEQLDRAKMLKARQAGG